MDPDTLSYLHTPMSFCYRYQTIPDRLKLLADELGDREAFVFLRADDKRESITARELLRKSTQMARSLVKFGIAKGDIVGLCLDNNLECLLCYFGVILAGGVIFSFAIANKDASDVKRKLKELDVDTFILYSNEQHEQFHSSLNFIDDVRPDGAATSVSVPSLKRFVSTSKIADYSPLLLEDLFMFAADDDVNIELPRPDPEDALIMYATSGSTGWPKFIPYTHHTVMITGYQLHHVVPFDADDIMYNERKLVWVGGFPFGYLHNGLKTVYKCVTLPSLEDHCRFTMRAILAEHCSFATLTIATVVETIQSGAFKDYPIPMLKDINVTGQPCPPATMTAVGVLANRLTNLYGSTECVGLCCALITDAEEFIPFSTGKPLPGMEIKVVGTDGHVVQRGETGTVHVRSPTVLYKYYNNPAKSKEAISSTHWFNMNDVGYVTPDGALVVMGREAEQIVQGSHIVHSAVVEAVVKSHPAVVDVVVVPIPDPVIFQRVCACVVLKPGCTLNVVDLVEFYKSREYTANRDPFYSLLLKEVVVFDSFPILPSHKPDKVKITERAIHQINIVNDC